MSLEEKIKDRIRKTGFITIDEFMEIALFDPQKGYYITKNPIGEKSDFITSPEISVLFGEILGAFIVNQIKENLKGYNKINLIELGPGKGTLFNDILNLISKFPDIYQKINCYILEINPVLVEIQNKILIDHKDKINWLNSLDQIKEISPCIYIANEFFDALPIKQLIRAGSGAKERVIRLDNDNNFVFDSIEAKAPKIIANDIPDHDENSVIEFSQQTVNFMERICDDILKNKGFALMIDYGYTGFVSGDTLQSVQNHKYNSIFEDIGNADITSHVNFRILYNIALQRGMKDIHISTQGDFLRSMGIIQRAENLAKNLNDKEKRDLFMRVNRLINFNQMGELFKFLVIENF